MDFPEIPKTWIVLVLILGMMIMRSFGIDTFVTAGLGILIGYVTGKHIEQTKCQNTELNKK